jgi:hypothetical protein
VPAAGSDAGRQRVAGTCARDIPRPASCVAAPGQHASSDGCWSVPAGWEAPGAWTVLHANLPRSAATRAWALSIAVLCAGVPVPKVVAPGSISRWCPVCKLPEATRANLMCNALSFEVPAPSFERIVADPHGGRTEATPRALSPSRPSIARNGQEQDSVSSTMLVYKAGGGSEGRERCTTSRSKQVDFQRSVGEHRKGTATPSACPSESKGLLPVRNLCQT